MQVGRYHRQEIFYPIGREGQEMGLLTLEQLREFDADMFTTVFIGNSQTVRIGERMVTPRGYV